MDGTKKATAKFPGRCARCGVEFNAGAPIELLPMGWAELDCPADPSEEDVEDCMLLLADAGDR